MNQDEIKNALTHVLVGWGTAWAATHGIDHATVESLVSAGVALAAAFYTVASHWNKVKVPEAKN